jgi:iron complex transport system substrate-binding protein
LVFGGFAIKTLLTISLLAGCLINGYAQDACPQRIISLSPTITEEIYLLGAEDSLLADTIYCNRPLNAQKKEKVGTVVEVNLEKIVSLKPGLVLASELTNQKAVVKLKTMGIKVVIFPAAKSFEEICGQFMELGSLLGKEEKAEEAIRDAQSRVDSIKENLKLQKKPKVFMQIGARPLFAAAGGSFLNDFIVFAGGINVVSESRVGLYSREEVIRSNPDVIIIADMGIAGEQERMSWQKYKNLNAARDNRIYIIDSYKICSPTPASFVETLKEIAGILHNKNE